MNKPRVPRESVSAAWRREEKRGAEQTGPQQVKCEPWSRRRGREISEMEQQEQRAWGRVWLASRMAVSEGESARRRGQRGTRTEGAGPYGLCKDPGFFSV
jgi:hypothetical protein